MADAFLKLVGGSAKFNRAKYDRNLDKPKEDKRDTLRKVQLEEKAQKAKAKSIRQQFDFFGQSKEVVAESSSEDEDEVEENADDFLSDDDDEDDDENDDKANKSSMSLTQLQTKYEISVQGNDIPDLQDTFAAMNTVNHVPKYLLRNILTSVADGGFGYTKPTPIQMQAIPTLLSNREVLAFAPTGSGKTMSFALPMMTLLDSPPPEGEYTGFVNTYYDFRVQKPKAVKEVSVDESDSDDDVVEEPRPMATVMDTPQQHKVLPFRGIVLAPTRELAFQTFKVIKSLGKGRPWRVVMLSKDTQKKISKSINEKNKKNKKTTVTADGDDDDDEEEVVGAVEGDDDVDVDSDDELNQDNLMKQLDKSDADNMYSRYGIHNGDADDDSNDAINHRQILVSTPLMLVVLLNKTKAILPLVRCVVFDEADRLFDLGFVEQMDRIMRRCVNPKILRVLCSATITTGVEILSKSLLRDPVRIVVGGRNVAQSMVSQKLMYVGNEDGKALGIRQMVLSGMNVPMLIFVQSKDRAMQLYDDIRYQPIHAGVIHSDMSPSDRIDAMNNFRSGKVWVLICTDLMARGIDFKHVNCVLNYDFPQTVASYIHRIGRTGRAGRRGEAITFVTEDDQVLLRSIANIARNSAIAQEFGYSAIGRNIVGQQDVEVNVPKWMLEIKKGNSSAIKRLAEFAPKRKDINTVNKKSRDKMLLLNKKRSAKLVRTSGVTSKSEVGHTQKIQKRKATDEQPQQSIKKKNKKDHQSIFRSDKKQSSHKNDQKQDKKKRV